MKAHIAVLLVFVGLAASSTTESRTKRGDYEAPWAGGGKTTSLGGKQLVALAQGAAAQASNAIANQKAAGGQAAFQVTQALAQNAEQAANTAKVALAAKLEIASLLERNLGEAKVQLGAEAAQLEVSQVVAQLAAQAAQQAQSVANALSSILAAQQGGAGGADTLNQKALRLLAAQTDMVQKAKLRVGQLSQELHIARVDLSATQEAAARAEQSSQLAQAKAVLQGSSGGEHPQVHHH